MVVLSASKSKNIDKWENSDTEEDPEGGSGSAGGLMEPFVNIVGAVVGNGAILDIGEGWVSGGRFTAIGGTGEINFHSLEETDGQVEISRVVGALESILDGLVGFGAFRESVNCILSKDRGWVGNHGLDRLLVLPLCGIYEKQQRYF